MDQVVRLSKNHKEIKENLESIEGEYRQIRQTYLPEQTISISRQVYVNSELVGRAIIIGDFAHFTGSSSIFTSTAIDTAFNLPNSIAKAEKADEKYDGWVTRYIPANYKTEYNPYPHIVMKEQFFKL